MVTIRRKRKDIQPADPTNSIAHSVLKAAVLHRRWQETLVQCATAVPNQRAAQQAALTPLIEASLTPSVSVLIEHARQHGLITEEQASELSKGHVAAFDGVKEVVRG